jgi:very-short-patch-repair endonuclease
MRQGQKRDFARKLRRGMTDAERCLWRILRKRQIDGHRFRRQCPIDRFVVDFACLEKALIVEVDGGQHAGSSQDHVRDACLAGLGYRVMRFWDNDVLENIEGVYDMIRIALSDSPHPDLPPHAGEGEAQADHRLQPSPASDLKEKSR